MSAEVTGNPEADVLTSLNQFRVTVGGTAPDSHRLAVLLSPCSRLGTSGSVIQFYENKYIISPAKGQQWSALTPLVLMVIIDKRLFNWTVNRALSDNYLRKEGAGLPYYT